MRRLIVGGFISIDGVMQAPGGAQEDPTGGFDLGGWVAPHFDDTLGGFLSETFEGGDYDLLLGGRTYDIFAAHWPHHTDEPIGQAFDRICKYVVTSRAAPLAWKGAEALAGDPRESVARLKASDGPDLLVQGSTQLWPALLAARLVDRLFLATMPIVLGRGKRPFGDASAPIGMTLVDHRIAKTGVVITVYEPTGDVPIADIEAGPPSTEEIARRETLARGT